MSVHSSEQRQLICHPDTPGKAVRSVAVEVSLSFEDGFALRYIVGGSIADLVLPHGEGELIIADSATDGLLESTCFQAFLTAEGQPNSTAFHYNPDRPCACYQSTHYRSLLRHPKPP